MRETCWDCKFLEYTTGREDEPAYSEVTPGWPGELPEMKCQIGHWKVDFERDSQPEFRSKMLTAKTCPDFDEVPT